MPLNEAHLRRMEFAPIETVLTDKDLMLYALSIGLGRNPLDRHDLQYVFEQDLRSFPTMPLVIGHPGPGWLTDPKSGVTRNKIVYGAQALESFKPLPVGRTLVSENKIIDVQDKGEKGAVVVMARDTYDKAAGERLARTTSQIFCRADGGFSESQGEAEGMARPVPAWPDREADQVLNVETATNQALFYRLNQDRNPLHVDPEVAARAGFARPILHGLATYGAVAAAFARLHPDASLRAFEARFSRPVLPGDSLLLEFWRRGPGDIVFRAGVRSRPGLVLDLGRAEFA